MPLTVSTLGFLLHRDGWPAPYTGVAKPVVFKTIHPEIPLIEARRCK